MRTLLFLALAAVPLAFPQKKAPQPKPPVIQVVEAAAHREDGNLAIDAKLKNTGERTAMELKVIVDVLDSDKRVLTTQSGGSEPESVEAGDVAEFHAQMSLPPRAVYIRFSFEETGGRYLNVTNPGPFPIE
jgi:hypothetical protein